MLVFRKILRTYEMDDSTVNHDHETHDQIF